jgi:hypothetical protein
VALVVLVFTYRLRLWRRLPAYVAQSIEAGGGRVPVWLQQSQHWFQLLPVERLFAVVGWTLRVMGHPQPSHATPAAQAAALSQLIPSAATHVNVLRTQLETGLFTNREVDLTQSRKASLMVLLHGLRARWAAIVAGKDGRTVYSGTDFPRQSRGTR